VIDIFSFSHYKIFIKNYQKSLPKEGWGFVGHLAKVLHVNSTYVSQVLNGDKNFTLEQGLEVCHTLGLNDLQMEYFLSLLNYERAGTIKLKNYYEGQRQEIFKRSELVSHRIKKAVELGQEQKAYYYSDPFIIILKLLSSLENFNSLEEMAAYLNLPVANLSSHFNFLIENGLIIQDENGLKSGITRTHLKADEPLVQRHHTNWRLYATHHYQKLTSEELAFTAPLTISEKDFARAKKEILALISSLSQLVGDSKGEIPAVLTIDWLKIR